MGNHSEAVDEISNLAVQSPQTAPDEQQAPIVQPTSEINMVVTDNSGNNIQLGEGAQDLTTK